MTLPVQIVMQTWCFMSQWQTMFLVRNANDNIVILAMWMLSCSEDRLFVISNFVICDEKWISVFLFVSVLVIDNCRPAMCVCARRVVVDVLIVVSSLVMTFDHQFLHSTPLQHFRLLLDWHSWLKLVNYAIFFVVFDRRLSNGNLVVLLSYLWLSLSGSGVSS